MTTTTTTHPVSQDFYQKVCHTCSVDRHIRVVLYATDGFGHFSQYNKRHRYFWDTPNHTFTATCGECKKDTIVRW
jgi:hypothetical protein